MTDTPSRCFARNLVARGLAAEHEIRGCSAEQIGEIRCGRDVPVLPDSYLVFRTVMGRGAGGLLRGSHLYYPAAKELYDGGVTLLRECGLDPRRLEGATVVSLHQGYQLYFLPADWEAMASGSGWYEEGGAAPAPRYDSLLEYLRRCADGDRPGAGSVASSVALPSYMRSMPKPAAPPGG